MSSDYCFVCSSDEGIFMDIFAEGKDYRQNIENCLSVKLQKTKISTTKVCHKCVHELDQCGKFVERYKKTHRTQKGKVFKKEGFCCLCMERGKKDKIYDLWDENNLTNLIEKIEKLFNDDLLTENTCNLSICLDCRYNLDVLTDFKSMSNNRSRKQLVINGKFDPPKSKISTRVLQRKTTKNTPKSSQSSETSEESDSASSLKQLPRVKSKISPKKSKQQGRECESCHVKVPNGVSMYRYHSSGQVVCQDCWTTKDPIEASTSTNKKIQKSKNSSSAETKMCSVFLKDILSFPVTTSIKREPSYTIETTSNGDKIFVISDDSVADESTSKKSVKNPKKRKTTQADTKTTKESRIENPSVANKRATRASSVQSNASSIQTQKSERKYLSESAENVEAVKTRGRGRPRKFTKTSPIIENKRVTRPRTATKYETSLDELIEEINTPKRKKRTRIESSSSLSSANSSKRVKTTKSSEKPRIDDDSDNSNPYTCNVCNTDFENRVTGLTHELTHSKEPSVCLKKVNVVEEDVDHEKSVFDDSYILPSQETVASQDTVISQDEQSTTSFHLAVTDDSSISELLDDSQNNDETKEEKTEKSAESREEKIEKSAENQEEETEKSAEKEVEKIEEIPSSALTTNEEAESNDNSENKKERTKENTNVESQVSIDAEDESIDVEFANKDDNIEKQAEGKEIENKNEKTVETVEIDGDEIEKPVEEPVELAKEDETPQVIVEIKNSEDKEMHINNEIEKKSEDEPSKNPEVDSKLVDSNGNVESVDESTEKAAENNDKNLENDETDKVSATSDEYLSAEVDSTERNKNNIDRHEIDDSKNSESVAPKALVTEKEVTASNEIVETIGKEKEIIITEEQTKNNINNSDDEIDKITTEIPSLAPIVEIS